ncbi:hypothetical protein [Candidatus Accumulibacter sp. ACC007]|uniref:hypothetical protein n=1 Tax=Candidatus Accumulibacter sp. ACC007 TaxID=2823333 RepID=UPI0025C08757|nr:hypothetical protein [Candidatus Accumulibacter sp. ACC007]
MQDPNDSPEIPEPESNLDEYILDPERPLVLLLGWVDHEGILSSLKATGRQYKKKILDSRPENWETITELFSEFDVSSVLGKFSGPVLSLMENPDYVKVRESLFERIGEVPNQIFVYDDLIQGEQADDVGGRLNPYPPQDQRDAALEFLRRNNVEIVPYRTRAEVTVLAESFLDELDRNLIFRLYVPSGRLWSAEADKFLQLFQDYVAKVDRLAVRLDQKRTDYGVIYEFHGEPPPGEVSLTAEFQEFSKLMDLCASDTDAAATILRSKNLGAREITRVLEKYSKEVRRLQLDIKHDAESKIIAIRHRLESELIEYNPTQEDWTTIASIVNAVVPTFPIGLPAPTCSISTLPPLSNRSATNITYNFRPQFVNTMNGVIAEEVHGNQHFAPEHHQLLDLIRVHGGQQAKKLETAVYEVADKGVDQVDRLRAKQRIKAFLLAAGKKTGDMAFSLLQKYLETQMGF